VTVGNATQIVTVAAAASYSTTGILNAWQKQSNGSWKRVFGPVTAHLGSDGVGTPSEYSSRTPRGTWGLTEGFGRLSNPGTAMPYARVSTRDWWVSDVNSSKYNSHQICSASNCPFDTSAGENLYNAGSVYDYAMVMDVNRWPAVPGGGSAFFLHVTDGGPTAGCVSINAGTLVSIMDWLRPSGHPRIAVGIS
jgi:L,D-peptidoglycan transpeptidase YkuD (ErfK/YbiS/YcfS/YnhG family)